MNNLYYKPSGKMNPLSILYVLLAIGVAAPILALIYTYAILYIPLIYLNFLCVAGIAFGLGFVASFVIDLGKVRNPLAAVFFGLLIGISGLYASWIIWLAHHFEVDYMTFVGDFSAMLEAISFANDQGTWGIGRGGGGNVDGIMLTIVWIIELIAMLGFPIFFAYSRACEPFIENDDSWAEVTAIGPFEYIINGEPVKQQLENRNYEDVINMPVFVEGGRASHSILNLYHGKNRNQAKEFYLSVINMQEGKDKDGNVKFDDKTLINFIHIPKEVGQQLIARIHTMDAELKAARTADDSV